MKKHEVLIIAKNTDGIIVKIMSLFNRRGYHALKMTAGATNRKGYTRLTLTIEGDDKILDQIQKQVYKITDVVKVKVFSVGNVIRRELMLLKIKANPDTRAQITQIAEIYRGEVVDVSPESLTIELTGDDQKLRGFADIMENYGVLEIARTGVLAMNRGDKL